MTPKSNSFRIADLSFGSSRWDGTYEFDLNGRHFEVQRLGADFSTEALKSMIVRLRNQVDAFAISNVPREIRFNDQTYVHRQALEIMSTPSSVPLCDGGRLRELANINGLALAISRGQIRPEEGIFFPLVLMHLEALCFLKEKYRGSLYYGDAFALGGLPMVGSPDSPLTWLAKLALNAASFKDLKNLTPRGSGPLDQMARRALLSQLKGIQYILSDPALLFLFDNDLDFICQRDLILPSGHPVMEAELRRFNPKSIINLMPERFQKLSPNLNHSVLDAALRLVNGKTAPLSLEEWQALLETETDVHYQTRRYVLGSRPSTQMQMTSRLTRLRQSLKQEAQPDFAFVIHCLAYDNLYRVPGLKVLRHVPEDWRPLIERSMAKLPGVVYGSARGIISKKNGREVKGLLYGLFATPRAMREEDPEVTYRKVERLCHHAAESGAKIIGLGAYTKIVGDAGATINRNSPIPVTTGNSLSASATLWALHDAVKKMGLLSLCPNTGRVDGMAMVVGATGSIGKVSAKLLSMVFKRVCLVAPRMDRLLDLQLELNALAPGCEVIVTSNANDFADQADALVTATSAYDQKIVDVDRLKPGCVVCDCSRPLDFTAEDAAKRPDVLIIESGEVILPGIGQQLNCDLGLPGNVVYACLGETAILSMEGIYEPFTLGREIEWEKVRKIYRLAREHGVELAAIRGHNGVISDQEIALTRQLALARLRSSGTLKTQIQRPQLHLVIE